MARVYEKLHNGKIDTWGISMSHYLSSRIAYGFKEYAGETGIEDQIKRTQEAVTNTLELLFDKGLITAKEAFSAAGMSYVDSHFENRIDKVEKE